MNAEKKTMQIVVMDEHFLYLPLYYAYDKNFFGLLPENYELKIIRSADRTDDSAFKMLMDTRSLGNANVNFAVADPTTTLRDTSFENSSPAILAALINNTAFWAVDRRTYTIRDPKDLATFKQIIAFKPGTTSHSIAQRIFRDAKKIQSILPVNPSQELVALEESTDTVALSPDILAIDHLLSHKATYNIDLSLGTTEEFNGVFMTALLSRQDVVEEHRQLTIGLLKALQLANVLVKAQAPDLITFAMERYSETKEHVEGALRRAEQDQVFPLSIEVSLVTWTKAAKIWYDSTDEGFGTEQQNVARLTFQHAAQPYLALARNAVNDLYSRVSAPGPTESFWPKTLRLSLVAALCTTVGVALAKWSNWHVLFIIVVATTVAITLEGWLKLKRNSITWLCHWLFCVGFQIVLFAYFSPAIGSLIPLNTVLPPGVAFALVLAELKLVHDERKKLGDGAK